MKIKEFFKNRKEYKEAKKTLTLMIMNQYSDLLKAEVDAKETELKAYESIELFSNSFKPEDLQNLIEGVNKIANNPKLTTEYYKMVHEDAQKAKKLTAVK